MKLTHVVVCVIGLAFLALLQMTASAQPQTFAAAEITSPLPETTFASSTIVFTWSDTGAPRYLLRIGSTPEGRDYYDGDEGSNVSATVAGLPTNAIVYVELWTKIDDSTSNLFWVKRYTYNIDLDADGIHDLIDPHPASCDARIHFEGADYRLTILGSGRVANLEVSASIYDDLAVGNASPHISSLTRTVLSHFEDVFDFIFFANDQETANTTIFGQYHRVRNDVSGLGLEFFDRTSEFGSAGKLQGVINFPRRNALHSGPSLHEILHRWAHYLDSVDTSTEALSFSHWGFSSVGGQLGGWDPATLVALGDGLYQATNGQPGATSFSLIANGGNALPYSELELYSMGLISIDQVPAIQIAQNPVWTDSSNGIFSADGFTTVTSADILSIDGPRVPDHKCLDKIKFIAFPRDDQWQPGIHRGWRQNT